MARRAMRAAVLTPALLATLAAPVAPAAPVEKAQPAQRALDTGAVLLAAHPGLTDSFWARTVLLAAPAANSGHIGLILNRPTRLALSSLFPRHLLSTIVRDPVYLGGPFAAQTVVASTHGTPISRTGQCPVAGAEPLLKPFLRQRQADAASRAILQPAQVAGHHGKMPTAPPSALAPAHARRSRQHATPFRRRR